METSEIKFKEIEILLELSRLKSIRELARRMNVQPGQITKSLQSLEKKTGKKLIERSSKGVQLSAQGMEILPHFLKIQKLMNEAIEEKASQLEQLNFASTSFFCNSLIPRLLKKLARPQDRFRILEMSPSQFVNSGLLGNFEVCIHTSKLDWPSTWVSQKIGSLQWLLCARRKHPIFEESKDFLDYPFISPIYWTIEGTRIGNDLFPIPLRKRIRGHETSTAVAALQLLLKTDHISFLPSMVVLPELQKGRVRIITTNLKEVHLDVYVSVRADRIKKKQYDQICNLAKRELEKDAQAVTRAEAV